MKGILTRQKSTNNNLRTNSVEGSFDSLPIVGQSFFLIGEGLEFGSRLVTTSIVTELSSISDSEFEFSTLNSTYHLKLF